MSESNHIYSIQAVCPYCSNEIRLTKHGYYTTKLGCGKHICKIGYLK